MAGFNNLDYAIVGLIAFGGLYGLGRGVLRMVTSILSVILATLGALNWHGYVAPFVEYHAHTSPSVSAVIGYVVVFLAIAAAVDYAGRRVLRLIYAIHLNWLDRIGGALVGCSLAAALAGFTVGLLAQRLPPDSELVRNSSLAPRVAAYNETLIGFVPVQVRQLYSEKWSEMMQLLRAPNESPAPAPSGGQSGT